MSKLFTPLRLGDVELSHRVAMAPLTRFRADDNHVPLPMVTTYYKQRASVPGTFIISEATVISPRAGGYPNVPGIWNENQVKAWREITDAVHVEGSYIFCQLWALGRVASAQFQEARGLAVVSSSAVPVNVEYATPNPLTDDEIHLFIGDFVSAAKNAIKAGFDGVEIHGVNSYLIGQFTQDVVNKRTDSWGGSIENRNRFAIAIASSIASAIGSQKTAYRLAPFTDYLGARMEDPYSQYADLVTKLKPLNLAYLHVVEPRVSGSFDIDTADSISFLADIWGKSSPLLIAGGFTTERAEKVVEELVGNDVVIAFGRWFIPNPDLPFRIKHNLPLTKYDRSTFYNAGEERGFIDWPFSKEFEASKM